MNRTLSPQRMPYSKSMPEAANDIVFGVGIVGIALIVIFLLGAIPMIPDFIRYLKIKRM